MTATAFELAKLLHVLSAIVWVGGALFILVVGFRMPSADPVHRIGFARDALFMGRRVFTPASVVALLTGVWMVIDVDPVYTFQQAWIVIGFGALFVAAAVGTGFILPKTREALGAAESGDGPGAAAIMSRVAIAGRFNAVVLIIAVWAMVFRPGF